VVEHRNVVHADDDQQAIYELVTNDTAANSVQPMREVNICVVDDANHPDSNSTAHSDSTKSTKHDTTPAMFSKEWYARAKADFETKQ
jgi:hypothetical protein